VKIMASAVLSCGGGTVANELSMTFVTGVRDLGVVRCVRNVAKLGFVLKLRVGLSVVVKLGVMPT
jgi:hypothetical protein